MRRFVNGIIPIIEKDYNGTIEVVENGSVINFRKENGKSEFSFFPVGNILQIVDGNKWIRFESDRILFRDLLGYNESESNELSNILYPANRPKVCDPAKLNRKKEIHERAEKLLEVGFNYSDKNLKYKRTSAVTKAEIMLKAIGVPFTSEYPVVIKNKSQTEKPKLYIIDIYVPQPFNIAIEIDGGYHGTQDQKKYDYNRDIAIKASPIYNIHTIRIKNETVLDANFDMKAFLLENKYFRRAIDRYKESCRLLNEWIV